jgi:hypothetical protein
MLNPRRIAAAIACFGHFSGGHEVSPWLFGFNWQVREAQYQPEACFSYDRSDGGARQFPS